MQAKEYLVLMPYKLIVLANPNIRQRRGRLIMICHVWIPYRQRFLTMIMTVSTGISLLKNIHSVINTDSNTDAWIPQNLLRTCLAISYNYTFGIIINFLINIFLTIKLILSTSPFESLGSVRFNSCSWKKILFSLRLYLFDQNYSKNVEIVLQFKIHGNEITSIYIWVFGLVSC